MRRSLLLVLLLVPLTVGQPLGDDPEGDVEIEWAAGQDGSMWADDLRFLDLIGLSMTEQEDAIIWQVDMATLEGPTLLQSDLMDAYYFIRFDHHDVSYRIELERSEQVGNPDGVSYWADLQVQDEFDPNDFYDAAHVDVAVTEEGNGLLLKVARDDVTDLNGTALRPGAILENIYVHSLGTDRFRFGQTSTMVASDRMPDSGVLDPIEILLGQEVSGGVFLDSDAPMRLSNGGQTTIVFETTASATGADQVEADLRVEDVPSGWKVSLPTSKLSLEPGETRPIPVLVSTPSGHQHGGTETFRLLVTDGDRVHSELELGLRYLEVPQPAGHHPRLWIHGDRDDYLVGSYGNAWMNALEEEPEHQDIPVPGDNWSGWANDRTEWQWDVRLSPGLGIGLDFDTTRPVEVTLPFTAGTPLQDAAVTATLMVRGEDWIDVGTATSERFELANGDSKEISLEFPVARQADFIPFSPHMRMELFITLDSALPGGTSQTPEGAPTLDPGGSMLLPLFEYHDPVHTFYDQVESISFTDTRVERPANPDTTAIIRTQINNTGSRSESVRFEIAGTNGDWATILGAQTVTLPAGASRDVAVAVNIPAGAGDGEVADLVISAVSTVDPLLRAIMDVTIIVDTEGEHPNDAADVQALDGALAEKKSPGLGILAMLGVAFVAWRRR